MSKDEGFKAAVDAIKRDGSTISAAFHHRNVACDDLEPDEFTRGWKEACDQFIDNYTQSEKQKEINRLRSVLSEIANDMPHGFMSVNSPDVANTELTKWILDKCEIARKGMYPGHVA